MDRGSGDVGGLGAYKNPIYGFVWGSARGWMAFSAEELAVIGASVLMGTLLHLICGLLTGAAALGIVLRLRTQDNNRAEHLSLRLRAFDKRRAYCMLERDKRWRRYRPR